jgi:hypothetical protein
MYGAAGAFRPKTYGVEYRVLSNAWLLSEARMRFVFKQTQTAVNNLIAGNRAVDKIGERQLTTIINNSRAVNVRDYLNAYIGKGVYEEAKALAA